MLRQYLIFGLNADGAGKQGATHLSIGHVDARVATEQTPLEQRLMYELVLLLLTRSYKNTTTY